MTTNEALARRIAVDEYGSLAAELGPFKPKLARLEELAKTIRSWYVDASAELGFVAEGDRFQALVGPKGSQTIIDVDAAYKALGPKKFRLAATLTLTALKEALPAATVLAVTSKEQSGSRALQAQALAPIESAKAA